MNKQDLISKIKQLDGLTQKERSELIELINTKKKYGLVWEDKPEAVEEQLRENLPVLREVVEKRILAPSPSERAGGEVPNHILIEGDNLHALTALTFTHEGKIDVIYIDPPYNTGNKDFKYNDTFKDEYIDKENPFRHSTWLSFMSRRLKIAKSLLNENGVIFCSIGNDEIAQLTLLFNEIFGENNQLGIVSRVQKKGSDKGTYFSPSIDYVIVFAKNKNILKGFSIPVDSTKFKLIEKEGQRKGELYEDSKSLYQSSLDSRPNQRYYIECPDGSLIIPPGNIFPEEKKDASFVKPIDNNDKCWRWNYESYLLQKELLVFKKTKTSPLVDEFGNQAKWNVYTKRYKIDAEKKGNIPSNIIENCFNTLGTNILTKYGLDFSFAKPIELVNYLINITNKENNIKILDFFAGSGTTLHATMALNAEDGGNRQCILVTNNENNICEEVTYERNKRVIQGYTNAKGVAVEGLKNNNLRYYKSEFVPSNKSESNKRLLTELSTDLLCIKEDCYTTFNYQETFTDKECKIFTNGKGKFMVVVYHSRNLTGVCEQLQSVIPSLPATEKVRLYVFSPEKETLLEEFQDIEEHIIAVPLPEAIYNACRATFKTLKLDKKPLVVPTPEDEPADETDLFTNEEEA